MADNPDRILKFLMASDWWAAWSKYLFLLVSLYSSFGIQSRNAPLPPKLSRTHDSARNSFHLLLATVRLQPSFWPILQMNSSFSMGTNRIPLNSPRLELVAPLAKMVWAKMATALTVDDYTVDDDTVDDNGNDMTIVMM